MKRLILLSLGLALLCSGCDKLGALKGTRAQITGDWHRIEMSFPSEQLWSFAEGVIRVDGLESGSYIFRGHSKIEVVLDGRKSMYRIKFPDDRKMLWFRPDAKAPEIEFRRAEN